MRPKPLLAAVQAPNNGHKTSIVTNRLSEKCGWIRLWRKIGPDVRYRVGLGIDILHCEFTWNFMTLSYRFNKKKSSLNVKKTLFFHVSHDLNSGEILYEAVTAERLSGILWNHSREVSVLAVLPGLTTLAQSDGMFSPVPISLPL
jgi:hypothetical protein